MGFYWFALIFICFYVFSCRFEMFSHCPVKQTDTQNKDLNGTELRNLPDLLYSFRDRFPWEINWSWIRNCRELSSSISRSPHQLPLLISFRNQLYLSMALLRIECRKLPDLLYSCPDWFINWILIRIWMELRSGSFQISSAAAEIDFLQKWIWIMICTELSSSISRSPLQLSRLLSLRNQLNLNKDLIGTELKKLPDLLYSCPDCFPLEIDWIWTRTCMELSSCISGSPLKLPRLISFRNQLKLNKDLIGFELRKLPDLVSSCRDWFPWEIN